MLDMTPEELMVGPKADDMSFCVDSKEFTAENLGRYVNGAKSREQCALVNVKMCELGRVMCLGCAWMPLSNFVKLCQALSSCQGGQRWSVRCKNFKFFSHKTEILIISNHF